MRVGFLGLGDMGRPMAERLVEAGHDVTVYDRRPEAVAALVGGGAAAAADAAGLAKAADVLFICVVDDAQVLGVVDDIAGALAPGTIVAVVSSVLPETMRRVSDRLSDDGVDVVDAPVTGSRPAAAAGTLTVMLGGSPTAIEALAPVLSAFASTVVPVGGVGMAQAVKIANNIMLHMNHLIALEAVQFARANGVDEVTLLAVANSGTGRSWVTETWGLIDGMFEDHPQAGTEGIYDMMVKEMWNAVLIGKAEHVSLPLTALGVQVSRGLLAARAAELRP